MTENNFSDTSRRLGAATLDLLSNHAELFTLELQEQKDHSTKQLIWIGVTAACAFMLFLLLNSLLIVLFWQQFEHLVLIAMAVFYGLLGAICIWRMRLAQKHADAPFSASLRELKKTKEQLLP